MTKLFEDLVNQGETLFIAGPEIDVRHETLAPLLLSDIAHFYCITPKDNLQAYLNDTVQERHLYSFVQSVKEIDLGKHNVILYGFKPLARELLAKLRKLKGTGVIFFDENLGYLKRNWSEINGLTVVEKSLIDYVAEHRERVIQTAPRIATTDDPHFTNRGLQIGAHRQFLDNPDFRCCRIIGMKGIGKRAFIKHLKRISAIGEPCFEIWFADRDDDITYLLAQLLKTFDIPYEEHELERFSSKHVLPVVNTLFTTFDNIEQGKLVFYNVDAVYDAAAKQFYDKRIETFFHQLLQRRSYRQNQNKVYLVANQDIRFRSHDDHEVTKLITLKPLEAQHIQYIVETEFRSKAKVGAAQAFMAYDAELVDKLLGGHPQIAKLFVEACERLPMESIVNDPDFRLRFEQEKAEYLMQHIDLSGDQDRMLKYLSLFTIPFDIEAIKAFEPGPFDIIQQLQDKFLLEMETFANGHSTYYVPSIVQDCERVRTDEDIARNYHNQIGLYYWSKAENLKTSASKSLEAYRLALHHFTESDNKQQQKNLVIYFKGIFLNKARDAYRHKDYGSAWHYYHEIEEQAELEAKDLMFYIICHEKLGKEGTTELYKQAIQKHRNDLFIKTAYANYLFLQNEYEHAKLLCEEVLDKFSDDYVATNLYPKILANLGQKQEALQYFQKNIERYKQRHLTEDRKKRLIDIFPNYFLL